MPKMSIEEIQDVLADFETRLLFLENSLPFRGVEEKPIEVAPSSKRQWELLQQLRGEVSFLRNKITELQVKKKGIKYINYT